MARNVRRASISRKQLALAVTAALVPLAQAAQAQTTATTLPTGGVVTAGTASISLPGGNKMQIDQASEKAILQWDGFSIGSSAWVNFTQPSASAIALNRVMGTNPSEIFGRLTANGQVFLSNPNGVLFAPGASVDVGALFATTLSITDSDFLAGNYNFANAGGAGSVINQGSIVAGSYAALAGPQVRNDGVIVANSGSVVLAAGERVALDMVGDGLIRVSVDQAAMNASAINTGTIQADGGRVVLTARSANALLDTVVNNSGVVRANSLVSRNGEIILDGGTAGVASDTGTLQGTGASMTLSGGNVAIDSPASIDASAAALTVNAATDITVNAPITLNTGVLTAVAGHDMTISRNVVARNMSIGIGGALSLNAVTADAMLSSTGGQAISAGALGLHAQNARRAVVQNTSGDQTVSVGAGGIDLGVVNGQGVAQIANNRGALTNGTQTVETTGALNVVGGSGSGSVNSGIFQMQTGKQTVTAGSITLQAATSGSNGGAFILNTSLGGLPGGDQEINVAAGTIRVTAGANGLSNRAGIATNGNQTINGNADVVLTGGASGTGVNTSNTNNQAFISANVSGKTQTINAHDITLSAGSGGNDTAATITSGSQTITVTGDVRLNGGANTGEGNGARIGGSGSSATNLTLKARDVILTAGTTASGAALGSSGNSPAPLDNNITIEASRDVILNASATNGVRIGTNSEFATPAGGNISVKASRDIQLNGDVHAAAIRTTGNVTLTAGGSITEGSRGFVLANTLSPVAASTANLGGPNQVSVFSGTSGGAMTLVNSGPLSISNITSGALTLNNAGALTLQASGTQDARIQSLGGQTIGADALTLHASDGRTAAIGNSVGDQTLLIGAGGIDLSVLNGQGAANIFNNTGTGAQTVQTTGNLGVQAGAMPTTATNSGVFQFQSGAQSVAAASITLHGSDVGSNGGAFITNGNGGGGAQAIQSGAITIVGGGSAGSANRAGIFSSGNQTIHAGDITLTGGANGSSVAGLSNSAQINTGGPSQTIDAANITVNAGAAGTDTFATITAANQLISATGDVRINGGGGVGAGNGARIGGTSGPTNLTLSAHNVVLTSGSTTGVGLGSMGSGVQPNTISVHATGDVVLNSTPGNGARIGSGSAGVAAGDIAVSADGSILLNGDNRPATIRTSGNVTLDAGGTITELGTGSIIAGSLTATTRGTALLDGPNAISTLNVPLVGIAPGVASNFTLSNTGPLTVTNLRAGGTVTLTNSGAVTLNAAGTQDARITSLGGQTITADALILHAQDGRVANINNTSGDQAVTVGAGGIDLSVLNGQGVAQITNNRGPVTNGTQAIATTGALNVVGGSGSGSVNSGLFQMQTGKQTVTAQSIALQAATAPVNNGGAFILNTNTGGLPGGDQEINVATGTISIAAGANGLTNRAGISTNGNQTINGNADIVLTGGASGSGLNSNNTNNQAFISANAFGKAQTISAHNVTLTAGSGGIDTAATITSNAQTITASGDVRITGGSNGGDSNGARIGAPGSTTVGSNITLSAHDVVLTGGTSSSGAAIGLSGNSGNLPSTIKITATGDVVLNSGAGSGSRIGAPNGSSGGGDIEINAVNIALNGDVTPTVIRTTGNVKLNATGSISEGVNGAVLANTLSAVAAGAANLGGPNQISALSASSVAGLTLLNSGPLDVQMLNSFGPTAITTTGPGADLSVTGQAFAFGPTDLNVAGAMNVSGTFQTTGDQVIHAASLAVTGGNGRSASLSQVGAGAQSITVSGGSIDVQALSGGGSASVNAVGVQNVSLVNGDHINVDGAFGLAFLGTSPGGTQTLSATGTGRNAITVGSAGALGPSNIAGPLNQSVTAGLAGQSGSITIVGSNGQNALAGFVTNPGVGGTQTITTSGQISITGGAAASQGFNFPAGIFHNGTGTQTISAAGLALNGGNAGNGNAALINSGGGGVPANAGNQVISVVGGNITIAAGAVGSGNRAGVISSGNQTINGNPDIVITGGAGGLGAASNNTSNGAFISANTAGRVQTINAGNITLNAGADGSDTFATINGASQVVNAAGDVRLNGGGGFGSANGARIGGGGGGSTSLALSAANVVLTGGATTGVGLGSSSLGAAQPNTVTVNTTGDVMLNSGSGAGARIGSGQNGLAAGDIIINAGGSIGLNGVAAPTSIRTTGNVTLKAGGSIGEATNGSIIANGLTLTANGSASLGGANQIASLAVPLVTVPPGINVPGVGGNFSLSNTGALTVTSLRTGGTLSLANAGAITLNASGTQDARISSVGGQTINADALVVHAQDGRVASIGNTSGDQSVVIGAGGIDLGVANGQGVAQIANNRGALTNGTQTVQTSGSVNVVGGSTTLGFVNSGIFQNQTGKQTVTAGGISLQGALLGNNGGAFISNTAGGGDQEINVASGTISITGGEVGFGNRAAILTNGDQVFNGNADIFVTGGASGVGTTATGNSNGAFIQSGVGKSQTIHARDITLTSGAGGTDTFASISGVVQTITATGDVRLSGSSNSFGSGSGARIGGLRVPATPTSLTLTARDVILTGGSGERSGAALGAAVGIAQPQTITVNASRDVVLNAGSGGATRIGTSIGTDATPGDITIVAGNSIALNGAAQPAAIRSAGNVELHAGGTLGETGNAFIEANALTTTSAGSTILRGPNQVSAFNATSTGGDVLFTNTGALDVTGLSAFGNATLDNTGNVAISGPWTAGGTTSITVHSDLVLADHLKSQSVALTATSGSIQETAAGSIDADSLTTSSIGDTTLGGANTVSSFSASSAAGSVTLANTGPLTVQNADAPGGLTLSNDGPITLVTPIDSLTLAAQGDLNLTQSISAAHLTLRSASGNVNVGSATALGPTFLFGSESLSVSAPGAVSLRGSDCAPGGAAVLLSGGSLDIQAGSLSLLGGASPFAPAIVSGRLVSIATMRDLQVKGGSGFYSPALIFSGTNIDLTVGGALRIDGGSGDGSFGRVQTATREGEIRITFPNAASGDYFVDGFEGRIKHGDDGLFTGLKPAKLGDTLEIDYGL